MATSTSSLPYIFFIWGVEVAVVYDDHDFRCNCYGKAINLAIESSISDNSPAAGYPSSKSTPIPETAYQICSRVMNKGVANDLKATTGCGAKPSTKGPAIIFDVANAMSKPQSPVCYFWGMFESCTGEHTGLANKSSPIFEDFVMTAL
ncbi:Uu.00g086980.m01.CDS01 [Anthostomella pinea]|uniref:Uu.00g086980.m01.CDS01 n=1 Tax=Anthostomella pinea TaxID=933095 RepID=A0AAI8VMW8_9PEZI|nr:Uu.00g086980.m01.CDS01 [Anthostomella pinea]